MNRQTIIAVAFASLGCTVPTANAFVALQDPIVRVADQVTALPADQWAYAYTVTNATICFGNCGDTIGGKSIIGYVLAVREFALPYFDDAGITSIQSPNNWSASVVNTDSFALGHGAKTLVWTALTDASGIPALGASMGGFGYIASFDAGKGPFSAILGNQSSVLGDPAIPRSPNAIAAGISAVPEPQTYALLLAGLASVLVAVRVRTRTGQVQGVTA